MDMLIPLYRLPAGGPAAAGLRIRKPIGPEHGVVLDWVQQEFGPGWASEARVALANRPITLHLALRGATIAGFACHDATARGMFGPIGVAQAERRSGIGRQLLLSVLCDMRAAGYAYAVAGAVGNAEFFRQCAGAVEIAGSTPGVYEGMVKG